MFFNKNIKLFENPKYVEFKDNKENLSDLFNNKIDNVVIKKKDGITLSKILINNPVANRLNRLELEDEIAFYNIRWD